MLTTAVLTGIITLLSGALARAYNRPLPFQALLFVVWLVAVPMLVGDPTENLKGAALVLLGMNVAYALGYILCPWRVLPEAE